MTRIVPAEEAAKLLQAAMSGSWSTEQDYIDFGVPDNSQTIRSATGSYVATVPMHYSMEQNHDLIAAAPDLAHTVVEAEKRRKMREECIAFEVKWAADGLFDHIVDEAFAKVDAAEAEPDGLALLHYSWIHDPEESSR